MRTINELTQEEKDRVDLMLTSTDYETRGANALLSYLPSHVNRESLDAYIEHVVDSAIRGKRKPIECCGKSIGQLLTNIDPNAPKKPSDPKKSGKKADAIKKSLEGFKVMDTPKKKRGRPPKAKQPEKPKKKDPVKVELPPIINADPTPPAKKEVSPGIPVVKVDKDRYIALQLTTQDGVVTKVDEVEEPRSINPPYYQNFLQNILDQLTSDRIIAEYLAVDEEAGIMQFRFKRAE